MEKYEYDRICTIANLVLKNYKIETPILDMKKVVEQLNGRLVIKSRKYSDEITDSKMTLVVLLSPLMLMTMIFLMLRLELGLCF